MERAHWQLAIQCGLFAAEAKSALLPLKAWVYWSSGGKLTRRSGAESKKILLKNFRHTFPLFLRKRCMQITQGQRDNAACLYPQKYSIFWSGCHTRFPSQLGESIRGLAIDIANLGKGSGKAIETERQRLRKELGKWKVACIGGAAGATSRMPWGLGPAAMWPRPDARI